jgi:uncharacterized protein (TIGR03435 family)
MAMRMALKLNWAQEAALTVAASATLAMPIAVGVLNSPVIRAQSLPSATAPPPKFEVASIKRCSLDDLPVGAGRGSGAGVMGDPGMFRTGCVTVRGLIQTAYVRYRDGRILPPGSQLQNQPIKGGPDWVDSDRYTIDARPSGPQTRPTMGGPMLQALLEDRFQLKIHRENKEVQVYALVVANGGPNLQLTKEGGCTPADPTQAPPPIVPGQPLPCGYINGGDDGIDAVGVTVASLCQLFSSQLGRPVIDKTGLTGLFNYHLPFNAPPPGAPPDDDQFSTAMATLQKLGLTVKAANGTAEIVVIDHVERPSEN